MPKALVIYKLVQALPFIKFQERRAPIAPFEAVVNRLTGVGGDKFQCV